MKILIVSATFAEIKPLANSLKITLTDSIFSYHADISGHNVTILITGVGMVATAYSLGFENLMEYDLIINAGIAGSYNKSLAIGETVRIFSDAFADLGADTDKQFLSLYQMDFTSEQKEPFINEKGEIQNNYIPNNNVLKSMKTARAITVNTISSNSSRIEKMHSLYNPDLESMEGAAFFYSCFKKNVPCIQIRTVSNYIEPGSFSQWNIPYAIGQLNKNLSDVLNNF